jgi:3-hydroxyisobutyrate dehydrogenase
MVAFLGMGLLGSNFVRAMRKRGEEVHVWNRTGSKAKALESIGAKVFATPAEAVKGANRIHLALSDDDAVNNVLDQASSGFEKNVIIIDHTTTSATGAAERTEHWKKLGVTYIHAPVFMGPSNALEGSGMMLISGDQEIIKKIEPELSRMTGTLVNLGTKTNKAAGYKLLGNHFLIAMTSGIIDTIALGKALHFNTDEITELFNTFNPAASIPARVRRILSADFDHPTWELSMARKDARLMIEEAGRDSMPLTVMPSIAKEMDRWIEAGHGNDDWTVYAKDIVAR